MVYVKVRNNGKNKYMFDFGCKGYGWCKEIELNKDYVTIQCEDSYNGARGFTVNREDITICNIQKENPYACKRA